MSKGKKRIRVGDVFEIPVDAERVGYGQVVAGMKVPNMPLLAIFEPLFHRSDRPRINQITESPILFLVNSFTVSMEEGEWPIVGNVPPNLDRIPFPNFKYGRDDSVFVISYDGKRRRRANPDEARRLQYRNTVSEALVARAFRAYHELEPWDDDYNRYTFKQAVEASTVNV